MTALYQNKTIRQVEKTVFQQEIATDWELMQRAGHAALSLMRKQWPDAKQVTVVCGKGNNAGDGFVVAHEAYLRGLSVSVLTLADHEDYQGLAKLALEACLSLGIDITSFEPNVPLSGDVIVDAVLGTGLSGDVTGVFATAIDAINAAGAPVLSLDTPSGLDADTGATHGCVVHATQTITFIALKPGLVTYKGVAHAGDVSIADLSVPPELFPELSSSAYLMGDESLKVLPKRKQDSHKGDFGHVLVVGGDYGMGGAVRMAAEAALRVGAGLVSVATRPEHVSVVSGVRPEIMCHQVNVVKDLKPLLEKASVVILGPGLGKSDWASSLLKLVLAAQKPLVLDADGLNLLSQRPSKHDNWILTPHPGEAARLLDTSVELLQADRYAAAKSVIEKFGGVCVLKGAGTIVQTSDELPCVCRAGNPGMATAGMGDVLSGVIGGLLAQGLSLSEAAKNGVVLHAKAADLAAHSGGERGLLATDLMGYLRGLVN